jgi:hypothetical protein
METSTLAGMKEMKHMKSKQFRGPTPGNIKKMKRFSLRQRPNRH